MNISVQTLAETGSTNDDLLQRAREGAPEAQWVRAESQTGGRGRSGRVWVSPPGNLYASTLVRLHPGDPAAPSLALMSAVALHEVMAAYAPGAALMLKWPNDLMARGAKLAGILLERAQDAVVIGFGVNLAHHPDIADRPAISLAALSGSAPHPGDFLIDLADAVARWLGRWRSEGIAPIRKRWLERAHPIGVPLNVQDGAGGYIQGLFDGLDETGALRLRLADGTVRVMQAGDVFLVQD